MQTPVDLQSLLQMIGELHVKEKLLEATISKLNEELNKYKEAETSANKSSK